MTIRITLMSKVPQLSASDGIFCHRCVEPATLLIEIYVLLFSSCGLCQYAMNTGMKADLTFDDHNERFDLSNLIRQQNSVRSNAFDPQSSEEYRRMGHNFRRMARKMPASKLIARSKDKLLRQIKKEREVQLNRILNEALFKLHQGRRYDDFAYHDAMESDSGNLDDFNTNLERFSNLKGSMDRVHTRRNLPLEDEKVLMHYAFPVNLRIEGYLQSPLQ